MRKLLLTIFTFSFILLYSQNENYNKVWDLLLKNKRTEARNFYEKSLAHLKTKELDALYLDAIINLEEGKLNYDDEFVKNFIAISPNENYFRALFYMPFMMNRIAQNGIDDNFYKKIDLLSNSKFGNDFSVIYYKYYADKLRRENVSAKDNLQKIGAVNKWQFCGVFENLNGSGLDIEYEPETYAKNDKKFNANSNGMVHWYNAKDEDEDIIHFYANENEYGEGIMYAQTFIESPEDRTVLLELGSSSEFKAFLNDVEIVRSSDEYINEIGNYLVKVKLSKGMNRLLLKSELNNSTAIFALFSDEQKNRFTDLKYYNTYQNYQPKTLQEVNPEAKNFPYQDFLAQKIKENPSLISHQIMLAYADIMFNKNEKSRILLEELSKKYPNSSLLGFIWIGYYNNIADNQKALEIIKNIEINDPDYYYNVISKASDKDFLQTGSMDELQKLVEKSKKTKATAFTDLLEMMIEVRKSNVSEIITILDKLIADSYNNEKYLKGFAQIYDVQKSNGNGAIQRLEKALEKRDNYELLLTLVDYYIDAKRDEDAKKILKKLSEAYPFINLYREKYSEILIKEKKYEEAMVEINRNLDNFPFSYNNLSTKGVLFGNLNNKEEAANYYKKSLSYNSGNDKVNQYLEDLTKKINDIDRVAVKDLYALAKQRRNTTHKGDLGVTTLLDEYIVNVLEEGGLKKRSSYIYEITSEAGIEELKEYSVNGVVKKAEIVKPNGSIVPAEENYGNIVFTNLAVGDVIILQYDVTERETGRFYKDFNEASYFNGYYPVVESTFTVISPENLKYNIVYNNGNVPFTSKKIEKKTYTTWTLKNLPQLSKEESFSKQYADIATSVNVGTLNSWKEIANWYSDLVKKVTNPDKITIDTFNKIFPKGTSGFTQYEIAQQIYDYIEKNVNYSSVNFRQSGYIPQRPSKTLVTKLGDCKDLSTLFMVLAQQAKISANLVLVSTNDNAKNYLTIPNIGFNHCIVKANLDGKEYFLEMTDKFLPFNSISNTNIRAKALVIGKDKSENENSVIIDLPYQNNLENKIAIKTEVNITEDKKIITAEYQNFGGQKAYYNDLFSESYSDDDRKSRVEEDLGSVLDKVISAQSIKLVSGKDLSSNPLVYEVKFNINEKPQTVGSLKLTQIPILIKPYTKNLIALENRKSEIDYVQYENINQYAEEIIINIPANSKFTEIPENKELTYKKHKYSIKYELISPNKLKITKLANPSWENVSVSEYPEFKKFASEVIQAEEQIIAYK